MVPKSQSLKLLKSMGVVGEWRDMWKVVIYFGGLRIQEREEQGSVDQKSPEEEIKGHSRP
jgi:hypothetical protein